jgi:hypothetical protein
VTARTLCDVALVFLHGFGSDAVSGGLAMVVPLGFGSNAIGLALSLAGSRVVRAAGLDTRFDGADDALGARLLALDMSIKWCQRTLEIGQISHT